MELKEVQRHWDAFGKTDPLWAIVTRPDKRHGKWKYKEFFACGEEEIQRTMRAAAALGLPLRRGRALDFGCGVGRLTQALGRFFTRCDGVDIAPSMIQLAREYARPWRRLQYELARLGDSRRSGRQRWAEFWPALTRLLRAKRCHYVVNDSNDLSLFGDATFDLIYSSLVLQHMKPAYSQNYIKEFLRVLAPGGLIIFQIPSQPMVERELPYKASLCVEPSALTVKPGEPFVLRVQVRNTSEVTWPAVNLGNHWLNVAGETVVWDDVRAALPVRMQPGQEVELSVTFTAPRQLGLHWLELDVVQEAVTWFQTMGSATARIPCHVHRTTGIPSPVYSITDEPRVPFRRLTHWVPTTRGYRLAGRLYRRLFPSSAPPPALDFEPIMEVYGVPRDALVKWIENHGGRIVKIETDWSVGKEWESFRYFVTKP